MKHTELVGLADERLLELGPESTHQHVKGGLYRDLGPLMDSATKKVAVDADGKPLRAWLHIFPYAKQIWSRPDEETTESFRLLDGLTS